MRLINRLKIILVIVALMGVLSGCAGSTLQVTAGVYVLKTSALPEKSFLFLDMENGIFEYAEENSGNVTMSGYASMEGKRVKCNTDGGKLEFSLCILEEGVLLMESVKSPGRFSPQYKGGGIQSQEVRYSPFETFKRNIKVLLGNGFCLPSTLQDKK